VRRRLLLSGAGLSLAGCAAQGPARSTAAPGSEGRWVARAALPLPRSETAWATVARGRMHIVGGYGEAGGGAVLGGAVQSAMHEAFSLGSA